MDREEHQYLLKLVAADIVYKHDFRGKLPDWVFKDDTSGDDKVVHEMGWFELVTLQSRRALVAFDVLTEPQRVTRHKVWRALRKPEVLTP